mmetsp:Transcript_16433/g.22660  ORF Transcript_16433/g.22660 Transcript_16433/m.22660 type:complete len:236 (-) Transcript_16433:164-871(-)
MMHSNSSTFTSNDCVMHELDTDNSSVTSIDTSRTNSEEAHAISDQSMSSPCAGYEYMIDCASISPNERSEINHNCQSSKTCTSPIGEAFGNSSYKLVLNKLPDSPRALAILFQIDSPEVFGGERIGKRKVSQLFFRRKYVWVNAQTRSLHWVSCDSGSNPSKSIKDSKFLLLKYSSSLPNSIGTLKGVVYSLKFHTGGRFKPALIVIITESGERIELQVPKKSLKSWSRVLLSLL